MVQLLFKFSWSKLDEIFTKSVSDCNQQPNKFKNSPRKKIPKAVKPRGGVQGRYDRGQRFFFFYAFPNSVLVYCFTDLLDNWFTTGVLLVLNVNCANTVNL